MPPSLNISDDDFMRVWDEHHSISGVSKALGISTRHTYTLRRRVEAARRISLTAEAPNSQYSSSIRRQVSQQIAQVELRDGIVLVFSDAHYWPGEPSTAHRALLRLCKRLEPAVLIANGDMFDAASLSRHPRIGWDTVPTARDELAACQLRMGEIERAGRGARRYWNLGNHDLRMDSRLSALVPAAEGIPGFTLREHFPNWQFTMRVDLNGDCVIKHRFRGGIHATFNNTLWAGKSIITGHLHSQRVTPISDYTGTRYGVDSGCVAETVGDQFLYAEQNATNWRSGFCVLTVADHRLRPPELVEVLGEGRVWFRGEALEV